MNITRSKINPAKLRVACAASLALFAVSAGAAETKAEPSRSETEEKLQAAQKRLEEAAREVADLSMSLSGDVGPHVMRMQRMMANRAVLGVNIGGRENESRQDGVEIQSVSPGGGAAEAGLKAGDVLTEVNGKSLKQSGDQSPRQLLLAQMRDVKPGDKVTVKYQRAGKAATTTVTAEEAPRPMFSFATPGVPAVPGVPHFTFSRLHGVFGDAEFVKLTPKLGQYFGSDKGLLVVRAPNDARLKLEEGDVMVDIDGRVPSSSAHAMQILSSYQPGEKLKLNVLRMKKPMTFDVTIPEDTRSGWRRGEHGFGHGEDALIPAPPAPPSISGPAAPGTSPAPVIRRRVITHGDEPV